MLLPFYNSLGENRAKDDKDQSSGSLEVMKIHWQQMGMFCSGELFGVPSTPEAGGHSTLVKTHVNDMTMQTQLSIH